MSLVLLASNKQESFSDLASFLEDNKMQTIRVESGTKAISMIKDQIFDLVITDENLSDMTGLEFVRKLVSVNPMTNCAAVSSLSADDFHEASEGLGILMALPPNPDKDNAQALLKHLDKILKLASNISPKKTE